MEELPFVQWLVWSHEHNAFWRPNRCGYTRFIERAGRYSRDEAETICRSANWRGIDSQHRAGDPDEPPSEICFPAPEAVSDSPQSITVTELQSVLLDARLQLEYLDGKFTPTGSTAAVVARIDAALSKVSPL